MRWDTQDPPRGLLRCELVRPAGPPELYVMCVHLGLNEAHRRHQLARLCETVCRDVPTDAPPVGQIQAFCRASLEVP